MSRTVLLTGITGYIARHVAVRLLNAGFTVRGSLRDTARADEVREALMPRLADVADLDARLGFVALDLARDDGWADAMAGIDTLVHTASPFPGGKPKHPDDVIRPAVDGTRRALTAAAEAGVNRVVLTSSVVAIMGGATGQVDESDWSDIDRKGAGAYEISKTRAERTAWDIAAERNLTLTTINPGLVTGPPLGASWGTSVGIVQQILRGKMPLLPDIGFPVVDVRDVAEMHLRALTRPGTGGKRFIAAAAPDMRLRDIAQTLAKAYPDRKIPTRRAPNLMIRAAALFDATAREFAPQLGLSRPASNARAREVMDLDFLDARDSLRDTADFLVENGHVQ